MSRSKKISIIGGAVLLVLVVLMLVFVKFIHSPSTGKIIESAPIQQSNLAPAFNLKSIKLSGTYISLSYPTSLVPVRSTTKIGIEDYEFKYTSAPKTWILAVTVNKLNAITNLEDSAFMLRKQNPNQYQLATETIGNNKFYVFIDKKADGFSKMAIVFNGDKSADISLTGNDFNGFYNLQDSFDLVINSFNWK
jgi:hypothetical protein